MTLSLTLQETARAGAATPAQDLGSRGPLPGIIPLAGTSWHVGRAPVGSGNPDRRSLSRGGQQP